MTCKELQVTNRNCAKFNFRLMQLLGIWNPYTHGIRFWLYRFYMIVVFTIIVITYPFLEILDAIVVKNDLQLFTENICLTMLHLAGIVKIINLWTRKAKIYTIVDILDRVLRPENAGVIGKFEDKIIERATWQGEMVTKAFAALLCFTVSSSMGLSVWDQSYKQWIFPHRCYFPMNTNQTIPYWTSFTFIGVSLTWLSLIILSHDALVAVFMMHVVAQITILRNKIENVCNIYSLDNSAAEVKDESRNRDVHSYDQTLLESTIVTSGQRANNQWTTNLKLNIKHHQEIIRLVFELESMFSNVILLQFAASLVSIGLAGFQVTVSIRNGRLLPMIEYFCCILLELLLFCWYGDEIIVQSEALRHSAYLCRWYQGEPKFCKILRIFMVKMQRPLVLTAGNFCDLSLKTFMVILSRSYSYMAVLKQINE